MTGDHGSCLGTCATLPEEVVASRSRAAARRAAVAAHEARVEYGIDSDRSIVVLRKYLSAEPDTAEFDRLQHAIWQARRDKLVTAPA
jgi:hypothetical protein